MVREKKDTQDDAGTQETQEKVGARNEVMELWEKFLN